MALSDTALTRGSLMLEGKINMANASTVSRELEEQITRRADRAEPSQALELDCAAIQELDSSVVAILLSARRLAELLSLRLSLTNPPRQLLSLIELYEVTWLLD